MNFAEKDKIEGYLPFTSEQLLPYLQANPQDLISPFLVKCFSGSKNIIIFDTETNGLVKGVNSILSLSAKRYSIDNSCKLTFVDEFNRFYYSKEAPNDMAISVNGLTESKLTSLRESTTYPKYQVDDTQAFIDWCGDVESFVAYNIEFDQAWFPWMTDKNTLDAMNMSVPFVLEIGKYGGIKSSKLMTTVERLGIDVSDLSFHTSLDDVEATARVLQKIFDLA